MLRVPFVLGLFATASALSLKTTSEIAANTSESLDPMECPPGSKVQGVNLARACGADGKSACPVKVHGNRWHPLHDQNRINDGVMGFNIPGAAFNHVGGEAWARLNLTGNFKVKKIRLAWYGNYVARSDNRKTHLYVSSTPDDRGTEVADFTNMGKLPDTYKDTIVNGGEGINAMYVWAVYPLHRLNINELQVWGCEARAPLTGHGHGDPHLRNIKGEDFDVMQEGNMLLVESPRHSSPSTLDFALRADIDRLGATLCGPTYITKIDMEGRWVGGPIHVKAGKFLQNVQDDVKQDGKHTFSIYLFDSWRSHAAFDSETQGSLELPNGVVIQTQPRTFVLKVKDLHIVVSQPKRPRVFLDLQITGLETLSGEVGGLLGIDDHSEAERVPNECV